jgi:hypothetical protein
MGCDKSMCTDCATINPLSEVQFGRYLVIGGAEVQFVAGMSIAVTRKHTELNRKRAKVVPRHHAISISARSSNQMGRC